MPCVCSGPGFCQRHLCERGPQLWSRCRSGEMTAMFDQAYGVHAIDASNESLPEVNLTDLPAVERKMPESIEWAVGMCSAPRKTPTSVESVASIKLAGWGDVPFHLFAEPFTERPYGVEVHPNDNKRGAWWNFRLMCETLLATTTANTFLLCQDDAEFVRAPVRQYLEQHVLWPSNLPHAISLYTSARYTHDETSSVRSRGWHNIDVTDKIGWWGAVAFVMSRESLKAFVDSPTYQGWHQRKRFASMQQSDIVQVDTAIGIWAAQNGGIWTPLPSLVQHTGHASSIWSAQSSGGPRRANWMLGWSRPIDPPSIGQQIKSVARAGWEFIKGGMRLTPKILRRQRLAVCQKCPHRDKKKNSCNICGCKIEAKVSLPGEECPDNPRRWEKVILEPEFTTWGKKQQPCKTCNQGTSSLPASASPE